MNNPVLYNVRIKHKSTSRSVLEHIIEELINDSWKENFRLYLKEIIDGAHRPEAKCVLAVNEGRSHTDMLEDYVELGMIMERLDFLVIYIYPGEEYNPSMDLLDREAFLVKPDTNE